ncbi:uncharacterized protein LOC117319121, partial [Pecten maximus]|uniref:uncharacterized protein LOC117319121 n=1 Tax=Pecten maximus TaxID=6579 RepID=UPI001458E01A
MQRAITPVKTFLHSSDSEPLSSVPNVHLTERTSNYEHPFSQGHSIEDQQRLQIQVASYSGNTSLSPLKSDIEMTSEEIAKTEIMCNKDDGVGTKLTTKRGSIVQFLRQLLQDVEIRRDSSSRKHVVVKFKEISKNHFPALWKESGHTRLKKLVKLLALSVPV